MKLNTSLLKFRSSRKLSSITLICVSIDYKSFQNNLFNSKDKKIWDDIHFLINCIL